MLGTSLEARMTTQEKVIEERFSTMETVFTSRMQKVKTQSVDGASDMVLEMEDGQDRANNIIMFNRTARECKRKESLTLP